jgi:hypothetical protein
VAKTQTSSSPTIKLTLRLPESIYDAYAERAAKLGKEPEDVIRERLTLCVTYNDTSPIYLTSAERNFISQIAGKLIRTPEDLIAWARAVSTLSVAGIGVELSEQLLGRLRSRTFKRPWDEYLRSTVTECLEQHVGLR